MLPPKEVWSMVPNSKARASSGRAPISLRWVGVAKGDGIHDRSAIPSGRDEESYRAIFSEGKV